jgi:hypothetical protein
MESLAVLPAKDPQLATRGRVVTSEEGLEKLLGPRCDELGLGDFNDDDDSEASYNN